MPLIRGPKPKPAPKEWESIPLGFVNLTLDDVQDVVSHIENAGLTPRIIAGEAVATDVDSLKSATNVELMNVRIATAEGVATIQLDHNAAYASHLVSDDKGKTVAQEVASILSRLRVPTFFKWFKRVMFGWAVFGVGFVAVLVVVALFNGEDAIAKLPNSIWQTLLVSGGLAVLIASLNMVTERKSGGASIKPHYRKEKREVTMSVSQTWILGIATAVVSGVVGAVITVLMTAE